MKGAIKCAAPEGGKIADLGTQVAGRVRQGSFTGIRDGRSRIRRSAGLNRFATLLPLKEGGKVSIRKGRWSANECQTNVCIMCRKVRGAGRSASLHRGLATRVPEGIREVSFFL